MGRLETDIDLIRPAAPRRKRGVAPHELRGRFPTASSPCGRSFAVCVGKLVQIWATAMLEFAPVYFLEPGGMYDEAVPRLVPGLPLDHRGL